MARKTFKLSIKARILGILAIVLLLSLACHMGIFYYTSEQIMNIIETSLTEIYLFENKAQLDLKDNILAEFIIEDVKVYADFINREIEEKKLSVNLLSKRDRDTMLKTGGTGPEKSASRILDLLQAIEMEKHRPGFMFVINEEGKIIAVEGPAEDPFWKENFSVNQNLLKSGNRLVVKNIESIIRSNLDNGITRGALNDEDYVFIFARIKLIKCFAVKVIPEDYLNDQVMLFNGKFHKFTNLMRINIMSLCDEISHITLVDYISLIIIAYVVGSLLAKTIISPLVKLKEATKYVGRGNLTNKITIKTGDEIEELACNFNMMTDDLKTYIKELGESISREKAIEEEIKLAARIQKSSLPGREPEFKPGTAIDLHAYLKPSKIVSGDFYDYFFIDDIHLFFAIGDVSGKSISAALFMMTTKILMKRFALMRQTPDTILKNVNDTLALDNKTCMYSTIFCGTLNTITGHLEYCNAGHTHPLIFNGASFEYLRTEENMLVGLTSKADFNPEELDLKENDILFLYSDGVTEYRNSAGSFYAEEHLLEEINKGEHESACSVINRINDDLSSFSEERENQDDITMLCIKFLGKK